MKKLRKALKELAEKQEEILRENDHKSYDDFSIKELWKMAFDELMELCEEMHNSNATVESITKECCDVSNYMMMIADNAKKEKEIR